MPQGSNINYQQPWRSAPMPQGSNINYQQPWRPTLMSQQRIVYQLCDKVGHSVKVYRSCPRPLATMPQAYLTTALTSDQHSWVMYSSASYHITSDLQNLSFYNSYGGDDDIIIDDGK
ncbi:hypothetical protein GW17_00046005 [Ensete ventricosum]|nr:hypothetical protein GW17_00046005 [Ensete ventricosum]